MAWIGAHALPARRGEVIDAVRLGDGVLERRGDESGHQGRIGAVVDGLDRHDRVLGQRILPDRQKTDGAKAQHQDQQAHHRGEHGTFYEEIGEMHGHLTLQCNHNC